MGAQSIGSLQRPEVTPRKDESKLAPEDMDAIDKEGKKDLVETRTEQIALFSTWQVSYQGSKVPHDYSSQLEDVVTTRIQES